MHEANEQAAPIRRDGPPGLTLLPPSDRPRVTHRPAPAAGLRLLWIDDDEDFLYLQLRRLRGRHEVRTVASAAEGLALLTRETFDVVLCDMNLPGLSGRFFLAQLPPRTAERVIFATGGPRNDDEERFLEAHTWLLKPFSPEQLQAAVAEVLASAGRP